MRKTGFLVTASLLLSILPRPGAFAAAAVTTVPDQVQCAVPDIQDSQIPDRVHLSWVGGRIAGNEANRLVALDTDRLLEGYRKRPGRQAWDGEHVGKWLHAATLAWVNTGDPALRQKLDLTAAELVKCQMADGYLGTYIEAKRWTSWDVWAHKYNLIGLVTYMRYTGNMAPLPCCRRMADLLCDTFGDQPGKRDIIKAGEHVGMAPTSVLEPMVLLYRLTNEPRYLEFCKYILRAWEQPNGPHIVSRLLTLKRVDKVGNGKAYEMLSCLNGALEYYRTTGDKQILEACLNGWQDIVDKRLYITGAASHGEHFGDDYDLPNVANVGETCVTVTWLQFNAQLLRLTGEARFAEQLEHVILNQLLGAQKPDCTGWGYYVQMEGKKPYSSKLDGHCCLSSGPRGIALIPTFAISTDRDGVVVNLYDAGTAYLALRDGSAVSLKIDTRFPAEGLVRIAVTPAAAKAFALKLRIPAWSAQTSATVNGQAVSLTRGADGYAAIQRTWAPGDKVELKLELAPRVVIGDHLQAGKIAVLYGPLVLAADAALISASAEHPATFAAAGADLASLQVTPQAAPDNLKTWPGEQFFRIKALPPTGKPAETFDLRLVPFADAGAGGSKYQVWLPLPGTVDKGPVSSGVELLQDVQKSKKKLVPSGSLLLGAGESRSREGNLPGSIGDDQLNPVCTYDGKPAAEDWFALTAKAPVKVRRIVFLHGKTFHDGGWFDASAGKPRVQVQKTPGGPWETVGTLEEYPKTTATDPADLQPDQAFTLRLAEPLTICAVRVIGKPACGDRPTQAFSSCSALRVMGD